MRPALTSFVGRREELARLRAMVSASRLITITGPGGTGKTRLAEELAAGLSRSIGGHIAVAYLATASSPGDVVGFVAAATGLRLLGKGSVEAALVDYVGTRRMLLVLDNCEHVVHAAAELSSDLLRECPGLVIVATGRQPLHVIGEQLFPLSGLGIDLASELFADRARLVTPDFVLDDATRPLVTELCVGLEGMPLGIELAAAQLRTIGLAGLSNRLAGHLPDLASRSTVAPARQRTLRGTVDWSHELLSEPQRIAWRRLAVFAGGFTLDAAESVAGFVPLEGRDVSDLLSDLVDQSMVVFDHMVDRYRLLEALREFAHEELRKAGEDALVAARHRQWMLGVAADAEAAWLGGDQARALGQLAAEAANLHAALEDCRAMGANADGLRLTSRAFWYWLTRASLEDGLRWYGAFLGRSGDVALEGRAHWRAAMLATIRLDFPTAHEWMARADDLATQADAASERPFGRLVEALLISYEHPNERARELARDTLDDPVADPMTRSWASIILAIASVALGDLDGCREASLAAIEQSRARGDLWALDLGLRYFAHAEWQLGRLQTAETALTECLAIDRQIDDFGNLAWSTEMLGWVATDAGRYERAARLLGIAASLWAQTGTRLTGPWAAWHDAAVTRLGDRLGARRVKAELEAHRTAGRADALAIALGEPLPRAEASSAATPGLSARELEVASLVADGLGNRAIGDKLFLSPRTIEKHIEHVMDKLGVGSRAEIAAWHARSIRH